MKLDFQLDERPSRHTFKKNIEEADKADRQPRRFGSECWILFGDLPQACPDGGMGFITNIYHQSLARLLCFKKISLD